MRILCILTAMTLLSHGHMLSAQSIPELEGLSTTTGALTPGFSAKRTSYQVRVKNNAAALSFTAKAPEGTSIRINDKVFSPSAVYALKTGINDFKISLKSGDKTNTYFVKVLREHKTPNWEKVFSNGPFHIRDSGGELVFDNRMWLFGGYFPELSADVWSSRDGVNWEQSPPIPTKAGINIPLNYVYKDKMWIVSDAGELYSSGDGNQWNLVNAKPAWGRRYAAGGAVFKGKMWVLGGQQDKNILNDIWSSEDGLSWKKEVSNAPWSPRQLFGNVVVKDDKLWIIGGGITNYAPFKAYRDVWVSENGIHWEEVTDHAPWPARIWSNCVVYQNRIFLMGGFRSEPEWKNMGDVWYSADGKDWQQLKTDNSWEARHEHSSYVFRDKLWVVGGNKWPLLNDAWSLEITGLTFLSQPVLQEYLGTAYTYRPQADFNRSGSPVRYRLLKAPGWLKINPETGTLSGIPHQEGTFRVDLEAYDASGETARQEFDIEVRSL